MNFSCVSHCVVSALVDNYVSAFTWLLSVEGTCVPRSLSKLTQMIRVCCSTVPRDNLGSRTSSLREPKVSLSLMRMHLFARRGALHSRQQTDTA